MADYSTISHPILGEIPYTGRAMCTVDDPTGKNHRTMPQYNGTPGRVQTELRSSTLTPQQMTEQSEAFRREMMCRDGVLGAIACGRPFIDFKSAEISASAYGWGTGVKTDGTAEGTQWDGITKGKSKKPTVRAGVCVKVIGAEDSKHKAEVKVAVGSVYGSIDAASQSACIGVQFPPGLDAGVAIK